MLLAWYFLCLMGKNTKYLCNLVTKETCQKFADLIKLSPSGMEFTGMFKTKKCNRILSHCFLFTSIDRQFGFKGDLLCNNHFYKVWTQLCGLSVWKQPTCNGKNPPTHFFYNLKNHKQSFRTSCFKFSHCSRHRGEQVPPVCDSSL